MHQGCVFGAGAQVSAEPGAFNRVPGAQANHQRHQHHPGPVVGQDHEAQIGGTRQQFGHRVILARHAIQLAEDALGNQGQAESQQQSVNFIELVEVLEKQPLNHHAHATYHQRCQHQRSPVIDAELVQHDPGGKRAQHVQRAVGKVDDAQQAKNDSEPQAQQGIKRAIDQAQQQLTQKRLKGNTKNVHGSLSVHTWATALALQFVISAISGGRQTVCRPPAIQLTS